MSNTHPTYPGPPPVYFAGGFGYDAARNGRTLEHIETYGYETVPPLPDPNPKSADKDFRVIRDGRAEQLSLRQTMGLPLGSLILSTFQEARSFELTDKLEGVGRPVNAIFQSADALNGLQAASRRPDLFSSIIFAYPAGLVRQPHPMVAVRGVLRSGRGNRSQYKVSPENSFEPELMGRLRRPSRTAGGFVTAAAVALSDHSQLLPELRRRKDAPGVSLVLGAGDSMMRPEQIISSLSSPEDVDHILIANTSHGLRGRKDVMDEQLKLFELMEEAKRARALGRPMPPLAERVRFVGAVPDRKKREFLDLAAAVDAK